MSKESCDIIGSICCLLMNVIVKFIFIAGAIWMLMHDWSGCAMASIIGAIICTYGYSGDKDKKKSKKDRSKEEHVTGSID